MLTDNEIISEVAKLDDWLDVKEYIYKYDYMGESGELKELQGRSPDDLGALKNLKKYLTSHDAILPVIEKQSVNVKKAIYKALIFDLNPELVYLATARHLCTVLLKTINKWKD